jgi:hypothetical protein
MPIYSHPYDRESHEPAMPVVEIALLSPLPEVSPVELIAIVDSGADASLMPIDSLQNAGALYVQTRRMRGITGTAVTVDTFLTAVQIGPLVVRGIKVVAMPVGSEVILGRDVLNELEVTLHGPAQEVYIA